MALAATVLACRPRDRLAPAADAPAASPRYAARSACTSPIAGRDWGGIVWDSATAGGGEVGHLPSPPAVAPRVVAALPGEYDLIVVSTTPRPAGAEADTVTRAALILRPTPAAYRHPPNPAIEFPVYGWSAIDLTRLGPVSLAYPPSDTSARRPGVQASYQSATGTLELVFGNAFSPDGEYTDSGVFFSVFALDSAGFRGWWRDGGLIAPPAEGYFCAWRTR